jgi:hypothetical protein
MNRLLNWSFPRSQGVLLCTWFLAAIAQGHGVPVLITTIDDQLAIQGLLPIGEFENDGFEIYAEDPGFGVTFATSGPPAGTVLELHTTDSLWYWDGAEITTASAAFTIEAPEFDSNGIPNTSLVDEYTIDATSTPQSGMIWATYPGANFWDVHGYYTLSNSAPAGVYGVPLRIDSSTLQSTDPFLLTFVYQAGASWDADEGFAALQTAFAAPMQGDFNSDGTIDESDYIMWSEDYGQVVTPGLGADGNSDGVINAADYAIWRDALTVASLAKIIPEPSALIMCALLVAMYDWRQSRQLFISTNLENLR